MICAFHFAVLHFSLLCLLEDKPELTIWLKHAFPLLLSRLKWWFDVHIVSKTREWRAFQWAYLARFKDTWETLG